ncbi:hypothetical protein OH805_08740 [Streptomyces sp. NBC_00879]|uniref:hypothetical protein n=1 Tax=Streptomyces sp. NBC_00879 TaxID=2975855 RepID=UPI003867C140|nr:hypothetical protein OH805_08740 [Streptomyces sp. NBC_00879]
MDYHLDLETDDAEAFISAMESDAEAAGAAGAPVSDSGIGLRNDPENEPRGGEGVQLLTLLLTIPAGITVDVAADQIKSYLRRKRGIREATITWAEETVDDDGNVDAIAREQRVELDES